MSSSTLTTRLHLRPIPREWLWGNGRVSQLAFLLFVLLTMDVILRPAELVAVVQGLSIYETLIVGTLLCVLSSVRDQILPRMLRMRPISACVVGLAIAIPLSHLSHAWLSAAISSTDLFSKTLLYYLLLVTVVNSTRRLRVLLLILTVLSTVTISICAADYLGWIEIPFIEHFVQFNELMMEEMALGELTQEEILAVTRMCGTGIFHDPNDIALLIVSMSALAAYFLFDKRQHQFRYLWLISLFIFGAGLIFTRSRGGLLAGVVSVLTYVQIRYGGKRSAMLALLGLVALQFVATRQTEIDLEDGTGQERIQMWAEGLAELKSPSILFGIGQGNYSDIAGLVAHNSYVHAFVELGLFGGTFFFGMFLFAGLGILRLYRLRHLIHDPEMRRLCPYLGAMLAGWGMGLFGLSRCYVVPTFLIVGIVANFIHLVEMDFRPRRLVTRWDSPHVKLLIQASLATFVFFQIFVRVAARF